MINKLDFDTLPSKLQSLRLKWNFSMVRGTYQGDIYRTYVAYVQTFCLIRPRSLQGRKSLCINSNTIRHSILPAFWVWKCFENQKSWFESSFSSIKWFGTCCPVSSICQDYFSLCVCENLLQINFNENEWRTRKKKQKKKEIRIHAIHTSKWQHLMIPIY